MEATAYTATVGGGGAGSNCRSFLTIQVEMEMVTNSSVINWSCIYCYTAVGGGGGGSRNTLSRNSIWWTGPGFIWWIWQVEVVKRLCWFCKLVEQELVVKVIQVVKFNPVGSPGRCQVVEVVAVHGAAGSRWFKSQVQQVEQVEQVQIRFLQVLLEQVLGYVEFTLAGGGGGKQGYAPGDSWNSRPGGAGGGGGE